MVHMTSATPSSQVQQSLSAAVICPPIMRMYNPSWSSDVTAEPTVLAAEPVELRVKYKVGKQIGEGNFAVVKECTEKARKLPFALKIIDKTKCQDHEQMIDNEVAMLRRAKCRNIVQLVEEFQTPSTTFLVMELVTGGDLFDAITEAEKYNEKDASGMLYNVALALAYLHAHNIVHRDVKPDNLLVHELSDGSKMLKLGDFGLATFIDQPLYDVCGTPTYIAPEVLAEVGYGVKVDMWAVGVIAYILLCGFPPFSNSAKELIGALLTLDDSKRMSADDMLQHVWVSDVDAATDNDILASVANNLAARFADLSPRRRRSKQRGVAVISTTALDKRSRFFERKKEMNHVQDSNEVF